MKTRFQPNIIIGLALAFLLLASNSLWSQTLTATDNSNDAYIDVDWSLPISCMDTVGGKPYSKGVYLELKAGTNVIYTETIKQTNATAVTNTFRHFVGPNQNLNYTLTLYVVGPGNVITDCTIAANAGSTLAFQAPTLVSASDATAADRVTLSWQNKSKLSSNFVIVRKSGLQERIIATIPGTTQIDSVLTFEDIYRFDDSTSIVNGETYTYCIRTYSNLTKSTFSEITPNVTGICNDGSTFDIGLSASDFGAFTSSVVLTWTNAGLYADELSIRRNGEIIATILDPAVTTYTDNNPIYGDTSIYEVVLIKNGAQTVSSIDVGGVNPIGVISGFVRNDNGYGIAGAKVFYTATIFDVEYADSTVTDYTGAYSFTDLFFGVSSIFVIKARHDDFEVKADSIIITLSTQTPGIPNNNFTSSQTFNEGLPIVTITNFNATPGSDQLTLSWNYTSTAPADTTFFQLYREGQLIGIIDDAAGTPMQLVDLTAEPSYFYKYELRAYTFMDDSVRTAVAVDTFQFPMVTTPTNVAAVNNFDANSMDVITVTWNHSSTNFDGFRVYRNNVLLKEITDITIRNYTDYMGNPGESYTYAVSAFRIANNIPYESDRIPATSIAFPDFTEVTNVVATPQGSENAVLVTWNSTSGMSDNFTGFKVLRNGTEIGEIIKSSTYEFKDLQGVPGTSYTYSVKLFVEQEDTIFMSTGVAASPINFPTIDAVPSLGFSAPASSGKVNLTWNATYNSGHQNYDGFILEAPGITGIEADTIDRYRTSYTFYNKTNASITFSIKAYRNINGVIYTSAATTTSAAASNALAVLEAPSTVRASTKYPMHIAVSWEYPVYKLSKFIILKDGTAVDTLPPSARNYYDYAALPGVLHEYQVQSYYNNTLSDKVAAYGVRRNLGTLQGQVLSSENGRGADSLEVRLMNGGTVLDRAFTNTAGFYIFEDLPLVASQGGALTVALQTTGRSATVPAASLPVTPSPLANQTVTVNFLDQFLLPEYPPRLQRDSVVQILAAEALPLKNTRGVAFSWAVSEGVYDGFNTYRSFTTLPNTANAPALFLIDRGGSGGIGYNYPVAAFKSTAEELLTSVPPGVDSAVFPIFLPVENLSATPGYSGNDNTVIINWSRCTDEVSFYQIERNDEVLGLIAAGNPLTFEDNAGKPNQQYTYTVRAAIQNGAQLTYSEPVSVTIIYPNVASPELKLVSVLDSNAVKLNWTYNGEYVDGYRIYRDGNLIASLAADVFEYFDLEGFPDTLHEYGVEAVLNRGDELYFSEPAMAEIVFPDLKSVSSLVAQENNDKGNVDLMFNYYARGVDRFEIMYTATYNGGTEDSTLVFGRNYSELVNNRITFRDELAVPGVAVNYMVSAISVRNGIEYRSAPLSVAIADYPLPPTLTSFSATDGTFENRVELNWTLPFDANIDGFVVIKLDRAGSNGVITGDLTTYLSTLGTNFSSIVDTMQIDPGQRNFADVISEIGNNTAANTNYILLSYNDAYGQRFYSNLSANNGYAGIQRKLLTNISPTIPGGTFGWSVAIDGDNAVVGSPESDQGSINQDGRISVFRQNNEAWSQTGGFQGGFDQGLFGLDVDIYANIVATGMPGAYGSTNIGRIDLVEFNFSNGGINSNQNYNGSNEQGMLGQDVAIYGNYAYANLPGQNRFTSYKRTGNFFNPLGTHGPSSENSSYVSMAASDTYILAGAASALGQGYVDIWRRNGDAITGPAKLNGEQVGDSFGTSVDVDGEYVAIGAPGKGGKGVVYIYQITSSGAFNNIQVIEEPNLPSNASGDLFGYSVAIKGDYLLVGARDHVGLDGKGQQGLAFLFKREGNLYEFADVINISPELGGVDDEFGFSVDIGTTDMVIGAPYHGSSGSVFFYSNDLIELLFQKLTNVQATDGTLPNQTRITWNFSGNRKYINGFSVYRDDEKIATVDGNQSLYVDPDGLPGKEYVYTVKIISNLDRESLGKADKGFRPGNGSLEGAVQTLIGSSPVPGVEIVAEGIANGEKYTYKGLTDANGSIKFRNVFIGTDTITYTFRAAYENHEFIQNPIRVALTTESTIGKALFIDRTAFVVTGKVQLQGVTCGIDSVRVRAISTFQNAAAQTKEAYTNSDGIYTLVVEPDAAGLQQIRIVIDSTHVISRKVGGMASRDTVAHKFKASAATVFNSFNNFPITQTVNFDDTLTYETKLFVTTVCKAPASNNGKFNIEISTRDGCFQQFYETGINGRVNAKLPPLDDLIVTVKEVTPAQVANILIVDYLRYRPNNLDLLSIHIDNRTEQYDAETLDSLTFQRLVYHKPPEITLLTSFDRTFCGSDDLVPIISQNQAYSFDFSVEELHNGFNCKVDEGYLIINNSAATSDRDTLRFLPEENKFETHDFTAGLPNLVFPYRKGISIKYFSANNDFLGEIIIPIIVEGSTTLPGSDIQVDLGDPDGQFKFISYILRDPPGDGSFSSITENTSVRKTYTRVNLGRLSGGIDTDFTFATPAGGYYVKGQITAGFSVAGRNGFDIISTTSQTISTSNAPNFVGPDADVLVGVGVAFRYGIGETLQYDSTTCKMVSIREFTFGPDSIKTDWFYTVGILKQFVKELKAQKVGVENGTVKISVGGRQLTTQEAQQRLQTQIENWESVLNYHAVTSLPHVMFCSEAPTINFTSDLRQFLNQNGLAAVSADVEVTKSSRESNAKTARNAFCNQIGSYAGDVFTLTDEVFFTETLKNSYQEAVTKVSYWTDSLTYIYSILNNKVNNLSASESFFPEIENTTFSAGTTINKTTTSTSNSLDVIEQRGFFVVDQAFGYALGTTASFSTGLGVESGAELFDIKNKFGLVIKATYEGGTNEETATSNTDSYSYTLNDNDPGDQFSVTAIKGQQDGHSPYFQLFGGRSSCPPEPGTINRDQVDLALIDLPTLATFDEQTLNDVNPNSPARFNLQITNRSPFGENRDIFIYHDATTNEEGATLNLSGQRLGGSNEAGQTLNFLNANQPYIQPLSIDRAPGKYQFEGIRVIARPSCPDGSALRDSLGKVSRDTVVVSAFFQTPCSPITIASPGNNWVIRRRNPFVAESRENLILEIRDYQAKNTVLEEMYLEVRRIGDGSGWRQIPTRELDPPYVVLNDSLIVYNEANFAPGDIPKFFFVWDITELYQKYPDGDYEIRAVSFCGSSGVIFSNLIQGKIARSTNTVFAITQPADGIWQRGDDISIRVNKEINCNLPQDSIKFEVIDLLTGLPVPGTIGCFSDNNTLVFQPTNIAAYDDRVLRATVYDLTDESGNVYLDTFTWDFRVIYRDIFVEDDSLYIRIYKGNTDTISTTIFANQQVGTIGFTATPNQPWVLATPSPSTTNSVSGRVVDFIIDTDNLPLGNSQALITVQSQGAINPGTDQIRLFVEVVPTPPDWKVDPTKFSDLLPLNVIANWKYNNVPGLASDTLDLISAWIGNEIRGVAPITNAGGGFFAAYIPVYGNSPADVNKLVEFRIWDANLGIEYDARPVVDTMANVIDTIRYQSGNTIGTTQSPKVMLVDPNKDRARYIPLNPNGWTWFSLNSTEPSMRVSRVLRELQNGQSGDVVRTRDKAASFLPGTGWISASGGLDTMRVIDGFAIYRTGPADSIRITGTNARYPVIPLQQGWNFVGYPRQDERGVNDILDLLTPTNLDQVFTSRSVLDNNAAGLSQYIASSTSWIPGAFTFKPNRAYQIFVATPTVWILEGSVANPLQSPKPILEKNLTIPDPNVPATWAVNPANFSGSMIVVADLAFDKQISLDANDKIGAFINGECRGTANVQFVPELNKYIATVFVYNNRAGEQVEFRLFDASANKVYRHTERLAFSNNKVIGNVAQPYHFVNLSLPQGTLTATEVLCASDSSGVVRVSNIEGGIAPYKVRWENGQEGLERKGLTAGMYRIQVTDNLGQVSSDSIEIVNQQLTIPTPAVDVNGGKALCRNEDVWLEAQSEFAEANYRWYDASGKLLGTDGVFSIANARKDTTLYVEANVSGCVSARTPVPVKLQAPDAAFTILPSAIVPEGDTIYLRPSAGVNAAYAYQWMLDGNTISRLPEISYAVEKAGLYDLSLRVRDAEGCETTTEKDNFLQVLLATAVENLSIAVLKLSAAPNPFVRQVTVTMEVEKGGEYLLNLRDMAGRTLWRQKQTLIAGRNESLLDLRNTGLAEGAYLLEVSNKEGEKAIIKLIKRATP